MRGLPSTLAVLALISACAPAPPRSPPPDPAQLAADYQQRRLTQLPGLPASAQDWDRGQWLQAALQLNPALAQARTQIRIAQAAERGATQRANPEISLNAGYIHGSALELAGQASGWLYGLALDLLLPRRGERQRAIAEAQLRTRIAQITLMDAVWQLRSSLREALLALRYSDAALQASAAMLDTERTLQRATQRRVAAGDLAPSALLGVEQSLRQREQQHAELQAQARQARLDLAAAVGVPPEALATLDPRWDDWQAIDTLPSDDLPAQRQQALLTRADVLQALRDCELRELQLQDELARRWPALRLSPALSWDRDSQEYALGVGLPLPLMNRNEAAIAQAEAERESAARALLATQARVLDEMARAEARWQQARTQWLAAQQNTALAQREQQRAQRALELGASDRSALLQAQLATAAAHLQALSAARAAQQAYAQLESAYRRPLQGPELQLAPWPETAS